MTDQQFRRTVWGFYRQHGRSLPWRRTDDPYAILVSEAMLQQTQVPRVIPKYEDWLRQFPNPLSLAQASKRSVLQQWQGLGYNRRALNLQRAAQHIAAEHEGSVPKRLEHLLALPGVGPYTASAVLAFAFNKPVTMIETNIRTVYLHHFFPEQQGVSDEHLLPLIERTVSSRKPREWYWALMDYGSHLKSQVANPSRRSRHHVVQSPFEGSNRQVRGRIVRLITQGGAMNEAALAKAVGVSQKRLQEALGDLTHEGFLQRSGETISIA